MAEALPEPEAVEAVEAAPEPEVEEAVNVAPDKTTVGTRTKSVRVICDDTVVNGSWRAHLKKGEILNLPVSTADWLIFTKRAV